MISYTTTKGQEMARKFSTRMHWVYDCKFKVVRFTGSKTACNAYWVKQAPQDRQDLIVEVAAR